MNHRNLARGIVKNAQLKKCQSSASHLNLKFPSVFFGRSVGTQEWNDFLDSFVDDEELIARVKAKSVTGVLPPHWQPLPDL